MAERDISAVVSDVDNTLIIDGQKLPSPEVQAVALGLRANGISLHTATARSHSLHLPIVEPLHLRDNLCILNGGATVVRASSGDIVWSQHLNGLTVGKVITTIGQLCTNIHFDAESKRHTPEEIISRFADGRTPIEDAPSVFAIFGVDRGQEVLDALSEIAGIHHTPIMAHGNRRDSRCIQVVAPGIDKQHGVEQMLHHAGLTGEPTVLIGDGLNDIALFNAAGSNGIRVAMGNAPRELQELADFVAPRVEEHGFAVAMEHYGLVR